MRYFTKELWSKINSLDENERKKAEKEWSRNAEQYQQKFEQIKKYIPKDFLNTFLKCGMFHDYTILKITIKKKKKRYRCKMILSDGKEDICLELTGIQAIKMDVISFDNCIQGNLSWGYCEIDWLRKDKIISLAIICDIENEMYFECQSIKLTCNKY